MVQVAIKNTAKPADLSTFTVALHNIDEVLRSITRKKEAPKLIIIDLFCGAGGTTAGFARLKKALVIACVNHDHTAIKSHWINHPNVAHFEEDIRTLDLVTLRMLVEHYRKLYPKAKIVLWASLECTNYSKAKGGTERDGDSRTLGLHLFRYQFALKPDYIMIENVVEFMAWGPLKPKIFLTEEGYDVCLFNYKWVEEPLIGDDGLYLLNDEGDCVIKKIFKPVFRGVPDSMKNGTDWLRWCGTLKKAGGYNEGWKCLNSADFGAYTSRNRLFGIFAADAPIVWPEPTHSKKATTGMFGKLQKWKAVKEVLDFSDEGESIFGRKKPLSDKTLARIYAGLIKYIAGGKEAFLLKYNSTSQAGIHLPPSMDNPCPTVTCQNRLGLVTAQYMLQYNGGTPEANVFSTDRPMRTITTGHGAKHNIVQASFLKKYYSGKPEGKVIPVDGPAGTITCVDTQALVNAQFLQNYYTNGGIHTSTDCPAPTLTTKDRCAVVNASFIDKQYSGNGKCANHQSIEQPAGTVMVNDKHCLIQSFLMPTHFDNKPRNTNEPAPTLTASRRHCYLVNPSWGGNPGSADAPCPVIVARQDKAPLYMVLTDHGDICIRVDPDDSEIAKQIKEFMVLYGIVDIKMRMLKVPELLRIQDMDGTTLCGTQSEQKKFIGNAVVPLIPEKMGAAIIEELQLT